MPPKKRRGGQNQVGSATNKMSTRSGRKPNTDQINTDSPKTTPMPKPAAKPPVKKTRAPKARGKKNAPKKKKIEVKLENVQNPNTEIEDLLSELERDDDEAPKTEPIEQVFLNMDDEYMETTDVDNTETETCEIREQLENLNVEEGVFNVEAEQTEETVVNEGNTENIELQEVEIDPCEEFAVEYITEEFVPVENSEVVIDEESQASVILDKNDCTSDKNEEEKEDVKEPEEMENNKEETMEAKITEEIESVENDPIVIEEPQPQLETIESVEVEPEIPESIPEPSSVVPELPEVKSESSVVKAESPEVKLETLEVKQEIPKVKKKAARKDPREAKKNPPKKKAPKPKPPKKEPNNKMEEVRRSSRIKSISDSKQRSKGHGLVKSVKNILEAEVTESANLSNPENEKSSDSTVAFSLNESENKPVKVKSRWRRSSELEMNVLTPASVVMETCGDSEKIAAANNMVENKQKVDAEVEARLKQFVHLKENLYLTDRMSCKEAKKMTCDCFLTPEEIERGEWGCGEDCLNRLLMIECGSLCPVNERCTNKKFQKTQFAPVEVFKTEKKGLGLRAAANIPYGEFILEYVGEVLDHEEFDARADDYSNDKNRHYYFMSLRADAIIDATMKGNISRFINHSCDPNAETQKWTVNGELRIGFFSTRTILAGEEITFDYRFQRYGKEAQKCYCEAATCRGWLGEEPDDEEDEDEEEDEEEVEEAEEQAKETVTEKPAATVEKMETEIEETKEVTEVQKPQEKEKKKRAPRKKPRKDIFEDLDQLDEEIDMLVTTGLKNQAHTLKLSRLMVRAKEPTQRAKLLRVLRRGELPCRRLFLDYHGLRLMHGYMTDAQDLSKTDKKYESLRLELLQTLATLPIPNKTMLQDSKVLPTVEKWSAMKGADLDSNSSSPQIEHEIIQPPTDEEKKEVKNEPSVEIEAKVDDLDKTEDGTEIRKSTGMNHQGDVSNTGFSNTHGKELADEISATFQDDTEGSSTPEVKLTKPAEIKSEEMNYQEEITALAVKLLEEWSNLKEVFKIPKKERIEQMKEHEREANRGYIAGLGLEQDADKKSENRYRILKRYRSLEKNDNNCVVRKNIKLEDRTIANFPKLGKLERRKMFALQVEQREEERRRKQREMWRQHEQHCILLGTDPRLTAPFDPNRGYQCIWNPQIGQWQNYPIQNPNVIYNAQNPPILNVQPNNPNYPYLQPNLHAQGMIPNPVNSMHPLPSLPYQEELKKEEDYSQVKFMGPIPPPVKLPPKWKCAKDKYDRPYYYHIKIRKSQWEPPQFAQPQEEMDDTSETTSSSDTSSLSSDSSSDESDSDDDVDDSKLIQEVRKQMEKQVKISFPKVQTPVKTEEPDASPVQEEIEEKDDKVETDSQEHETENNETSIDARLKDILKEEKGQSPPNRKRRVGLVHEIIISPRTEEDRLQFREDLKRYKMNKEKLKREKELMLQQGKKHPKEKRHKSTIKLKMKEMTDSNSETAKKIKEAFRSNMATVVVSVLNAYRKPDCKEGRITNTDDFKHLARKLTHFVMLKEMKHIEKIEDLVCTDNVKSKAREYIRKYMSKFGENYQKRNDEPDF